jgi:hypothetical protein
MELMGFMDLVKIQIVTAYSKGIAISELISNNGLSL